MSTSGPATPLSTSSIGTDGTKVVFLHGLFGRGHNFRGIANSLAPQFRSLLVDLPNHGRSAWTETFDYGAMGDRVANTLRADVAATGPVHVLGHSMGGKVAMMLALRHPDLVDKLVVVDIAPVDDHSDAEFGYLIDAMLALPLTQLTSRADADRRLAEKIGDERVRGFLLQNLQSGPDGYRWQVNLRLLRANLRTVVGFPTDITGTFDHEVLWMGAERSAYVTDTTEPAMRALFPGTRRIAIPGASHWVHADRPAAFVAAVREFLQAPAIRDRAG